MFRLYLENMLRHLKLIVGWFPISFKAIGDL